MVEDDDNNLKKLFNVIFYFTQNVPQYKIVCVVVVERLVCRVPALLFRSPVSAIQAMPVDYTNGDVTSYKDLYLRQ